MLYKCMVTECVAAFTLFAFTTATSQINVHKIINSRHIIIPTLHIGYNKMNTHVSWFSLSYTHTHAQLANAYPITPTTAVYHILRISMNELAFGFAYLQVLYVCVCTLTLVGEFENRRFSQARLQAPRYYGFQLRLFSRPLFLSIRHVQPRSRRNFNRFLFYSQWHKAHLRT